MAIICAIIAWLGYDLATIPLAATQFEAVGAIAYGVFKMTCAVVGVVGVLLFMSGKPYRMR